MWRSCDHWSDVDGPSGRFRVLGIERFKPPGRCLLLMDWWYPQTLPSPVQPGPRMDFMLAGSRIIALIGLVVMTTSAVIPCPCRMHLSTTCMTARTGTGDDVKVERCDHGHAPGHDCHHEDGDDSIPTCPCSSECSCSRQIALVQPAPIRLLEQASQGDCGDAYGSSRPTLRADCSSRLVLSSREPSHLINEILTLRLRV